MRKFTKLMLTLALLVVGVGGAKVYAGKYHAVMQKNWYCNASWNSETNTMSWTGVWTPPAGSFGSTFYFLDTNLPSGDITSYTKFHATLSNFSDNIDHIWLRIKQGDNNYADAKLVAGENNIDLAALATANPGVDFAKVTDITLWGAREALEEKTIDGEHPASVVVTNVYLQKPTDVVINNGFGDEITSLDYITGTNETAAQKFVISDNGTNAKYFYNSNENENADVANVPSDAYFYFTLEKYIDGDIPNTTDPADNIYRIKITNADGKGYTHSASPGSYLNALLDVRNFAISGPEAGWHYSGNEKKDALWYVSYDEEKGFSFQNVYRSENTLSSWLSLDKDFSSDQQYLKLYKSINFVVNNELDADGIDFNAYGIATTDKRCLVAGGGLSYNRSTGVLTTDGTAGTLTLEFTDPVDLKNLYKFTVNRSGNDNIIDNVKFYDADKTEINTWNTSKLQNDGLDNNATNAFINHNPVKKLVWSSAAGKSTDLTLTITGITWQLKTMSCVNAGETVLNTLSWNKVDGSGTANPDWNMHVKTDTYYGNFSGDATHYVDLTSYSELRVYRDNNDPCRAFFINSAGTGTNQVNTGSATWNAEKKYWSFDLSGVEKWDGKVALKCIKANAGISSLTVNNIVVYATPSANAPKYVLAGSGFQLAETVAALADATAACIDATGVTGITTNSEAGRTLLTSANPNCLFLGTTGNGGLANTTNVINSGTCDNLVLTDNYPFQAPSDFTATAASYTTTINTTAKAGTLCLPFAATIPEGVEAYTLTYTSGDKAPASAVETTIPANTPVFLTGSGSATFTGSSASIDADASNVYGALTGVFATTTVPTDSYVLQNGSDGLGFYKVADVDPITAKPFRAYLTASTPARSLKIVFDDETTGISEVSVVKDKNYFNLGGQRVSKPAKGLYIMNGKKVMIK